MNNRPNPRDARNRRLASVHRRATDHIDQNTGGGTPLWVWIARAGAAWLALRALHSEDPHRTTDTGHAIMTRQDGS